MPAADLSLAVPLIAAASLGWAAFDSLRKALLRVVPPVPLLFLISGVSALLFFLWAAIAGPPHAPLLTRAYLVPALGTIGLNLAANFAYSEALRRAPLSVVVPLLSLTPAFATLLAIPLLGETPGPAGFTGVALVVAGALWLNAPDRHPADPAQAAGRGPRFLREPGAALAAFTALAWSLTLPLDKLAVREAGAPLHGTVLNAGVAAGFLIVLLARREVRAVATVRQVPGLFLAAILVSVLALALQLLALRLVLVAWVETAKRGFGNFAAVLLGRVVFEEPITLRKLLASALMAAGVALLFL